MTSPPTKNIAKRQSIVICPDLVQRQGSSRGRKSTRTPRSPSFLSSDRCLWDKPTSAPSGAYIVDGIKLLIANALVGSAVKR